MIHYPHPHNEQVDNERFYTENIKHWWAHETNRLFQDRLRSLVIRANWNKRIICQIELSNNDLEMHRNRFDNYIEKLEHIEKQLKTIAIQYNEQRMKQLKTIFTKIRNYENKRNRTKI